MNNYSYTDTKVQSGTNYYRLKQIDLDGRFSYSSPNMCMVRLVVNVETFSKKIIE